MDKQQLQKLKLEEADGISFMLNEKSETEMEWVFTTMTLNDELEKAKKYDLGYKYQVVLWNNNEDVEVFEAIIGDVNNYITRMIDINHEGLILKKCEKSQEIMNTIFRGKFSQVLELGKLKQEECDIFEAI